MPDFPSDGGSADVSGRLVAEAVPGDNALALSVGELAGKLKRMVEGAFGHVRLRGEISGYKRVASGHCYLSLKDENAVIDGVIWKGNASGLAFVPQDGIEVIASGKLTTYPGRSKYQIVIERMELAGAGALMALLDSGPMLMVWVIVVYSVINFVIQSIIQPKIVGDAVGLSVTITFLSLVFWTWVLGGLGAILAIPLTLFVKALLLDIDPSTRWVDVLIGGPLPEKDPSQSDTDTDEKDTP